MEERSRLFIQESSARRNQDGHQVTKGEYDDTESQWGNDYVAASLSILGIESRTSGFWFHKIRIIYQLV